jgi:DNA-binding CsgD family transcriptional regulator
LTRREKQVVALLCQGNSTRQIATRLDTSTGNVNSHISHALQKFGFRTRNGLCTLLADWDFSSISLK